MTLDASSHATLPGVKRGGGGVLRSERMMAELSVVRRMGFVHCIVGVCLGDLIMRYVGHSKSA